MPSSDRDRLLDVCDELFDLLNDRFSEREEKRIKGQLFTQARKEKEMEKEKDDAAKEKPRDCSSGCAWSP
jgi:hypothetical protein